MNRYIYYAMAFAAGALLLCALALFQKMLVEAPLAPQGFIVPACFGGVCGLLIALKQLKLKKKSRLLESRNEQLLLEAVEREKAQNELEKSRAELEDEVKERTSELTWLNEQSRESEARWRNLLQSIQAGVMVHAPDTSIITHNAAACELLGLTEEQMLGSKAADPHWHFLKEDGSVMPLEEFPVQKVLRTRAAVKNFTAGISVPGREETTWVLVNARPVIGDGGGIREIIVTFMDITKRNQAEMNLKKIEWLLSKKPKQPQGPAYIPPYGDVTELNTCRTILDGVGAHMLSLIAGQTIELLDTSVAVYEKNGDYAFGIFTSGWCQFMDASSRALCGDVDNRTALSCGKWLCHDNCWNESARAAIESGRATDISCVGGIHIYAVPIMVEDEAIGAINIGYGDPPANDASLRRLARTFKVDVEDLRGQAQKYESRPNFIVELAKGNLHNTARLIGEIVSRRRLEKQILAARETAEAASRAKSEFLANMSHELRTPFKRNHGHAAARPDNQAARRAKGVCGNRPGLRQEPFGRN